jgi:hypothetical protein
MDLFSFSNNRSHGQCAKPRHARNFSLRAIAPDLIYDEHQRRYHIVQNDDYALVAAAAVAQMGGGKKKRTVGGEGDDITK